MTSKREHFPHYIGVTPGEEKEMLETLGLEKLDDLYQHISSEYYLSEMKMEKGLPHDEIKKRRKNNFFIRN